MPLAPMIKLIKAIYLIYYLFRFKNLRFAKFLAKDSFPHERLNEISYRDGQIIFKATGRAYTLDQVAPCRFSFPLLLDLAANNSINLDNSSGQLYITWRDIRINAKTFDNFYVASELFVEGLYDLRCNDQLVVCDVGMNVGVASLFFAHHSNVKKVYSFEPFPSTYQSALDNFSLNPSVKDKIVPNNLGVGATNAELEIPLTNADSASMSTTDFFLEHMEKDSVRKIKVQIKDVREIMAEMRSAHPSEKIFLKLDCEGAEYEIMQQLHDSGLFPHIKYVVIEWHFRGSEPLVKILGQNGYSCFVFPRPTKAIPDMGMIYAVRVG
jgi:FkbM family methyltransferase